MQPPKCRSCGQPHWGSVCTTGSQPGTANKLQDPVPNATSEWPETASRSGGVGGMVRGARTEANAVTAGETAPIRPKRATKSTAALMEVPHEVGDGLGESLNEGAHPVRDTEAGTQALPVDTNSKAKFNKTAYQREYMRQRRAREKEKKNGM